MNKVGKKTIVLSSILTLVILLSSIYIFMPESVKLVVGKTNTEFYVWENENWVHSGTEYVNLFDGTTKMRAKSRDIATVTNGDITTITRTSIWKDNITTIDTYTFDSTVNDVELFPISHNVRVINAVGKIVHFEYRDILYEGETREASSPESFGHRMKVEWQDGAYYSKLFQQKVASDKLIVRYKSTSNDETYSVRIFDPPVGTDFTYQELADEIELTASGSSGSLYVNYTKPSYATNETLWQVKHGTLSTYNITIPSSCWNYDANKLILRIEGYTTFTGSYNKGQPYCYNGTWMEVGTGESTASGVAVFGSVSNIETYDGNYGTFAQFHADSNEWRNNCAGSGCLQARIYEEGIFWAYNIPETESVTTIPDGNVSYLSDIEGWCNVTDEDGDNISYDWKWYKDGTEFSSILYNWDVTQFIDQSSYLSVSYQPGDVFFKYDGSKFYTLYSTGGDNYDVKQWDCIANWDVSTCISNEETLDLTKLSIVDYYTGAELSSDGTKLYVSNMNFISGDGLIIQYDCSNAWNVSSCTNSGQNITTQELTPTGFLWKVEGTKFYEHSTGGTVYEYDCSDAWNISSCVYNSNNYDFTYGNSLEISGDGLKAYLGGTVGDVHQYNCTTAWDISTCTVSDGTLNVNGETIGGAYISPNAEYYYSADVNNKRIHEFKNPTTTYYTQGVNRNLNNISYTDTNDGDEWIFSCRAFDGYDYSSWTNSSLVEINNYVPVTQLSELRTDSASDLCLSHIEDNNNQLEGWCNVTDEDEENITYEWTWYKDGVEYSTGFYGKPAWVIDFFSSYSSHPMQASSAGRQAVFSSNGTKMYEIDGSFDDIYQSSCSVPWNLTSCVYDSVTIAAQSSSPSAMYFSPSGHRLYEDGGGTTIYQSTCTTPWDLSTCTSDVISLVITEVGSSKGVFFKTDGSTMYVLNWNDYIIYQYDCTNNWNLTSCAYNGINMTTKFSPSGIYFRENGLAIYEIGYGWDRIYQWDCTEAWNLSTCTVRDNYISVAASTGSPTGIFFSANGTDIYFVGGTTIYQYKVEDLQSYSEGVSRNLINLSIGDISIGDEWAFSCRGYDGYYYSDWTNSSTPTIHNISFEIDGVDVITLSSPISKELGSVILNATIDPRPDRLVNSISADYGSLISCDADEDKLFMAENSIRYLFNYTVSAAGTPSYDSTFLEFTGSECPSNAVDYYYDATNNQHYFICANYDIYTYDSDGAYIANYNPDRNYRSITGNGTHLFLPDATSHRVYLTNLTGGDEVALTPDNELCDHVTYDASDGTLWCEDVLTDKVSHYYTNGTRINFDDLDIGGESIAVCGDMNYLYSNDGSSIYWYDVEDYQVCIDDSNSIFGTNYSCDNVYTSFDAEISKFHKTSIYDYIYQEQGDVFSYTGTWTPTNVYDADWTTYSMCDAANDCYYYVNYTKQPGATSDSLWQISYYTIFSDPYRVNHTIPAGCWNYDSDKLLFKGYSQTSGLQRHNWYCYDGSWQQVNTYPPGSIARMYEEGIYWKYADDTESFTLNYSDAKDMIFYIPANEHDDFNNLSFNISGTIDGAKIYVDGTLSNTLGLLSESSTYNQTKFNDSDTFNNATWTVNGTLKIIGYFRLPNTGTVTYSNMTMTGITTTDYPENPWMEIGILDGTKEWSYTGTFSGSDRLGNFTDAINTYLSICTADSDGFCNMPLYAYSDYASALNISDVSIVYTYEINPIYVDVNAVQAVLDAGTGTTNIPITIESSTSGNVTIDDIDYDYLGGVSTSDTILAHSTDYFCNISSALRYSYSGYDYSLPPNVYYINWYPWAKDAKNVTPFGQTSAIPMINITTTNYGSNLDFSIKMYGSADCVDLYVDTDSNKDGSTQMVNDTYIILATNQSEDSNIGIWLWADLACSYTDWRKWSPMFDMKAEATI